MANIRLTITPETRRRFILGSQGLFPGRRWRGKEGAAQALRAGCIVQVDPLNVVARSHDIALYGRVLDYLPEHLDSLLYTDRAAFDYGGTVLIYPMEELPYWRVVMARKMQEARWAAFDEQHASAIEKVRATVRQDGPLASRDIPADSISKGYYRSNKDTGRALYYLWLSGELMTHSRQNFQRRYDLRQRVAPPHLDFAAPVDEAEAYFALRTFRQLGIAAARSWRSWFAGTVERKVSQEEAADRLEALLASGAILPVGLEGDSKNTFYLLAEDFLLLETLHAGRIPESWAPLESATQEGMVFLAPLEIVSARGRALPLFGFEYIWEVYKPQEQRRWGYYTLPVLYGDDLVARFDSRLERTRRTLVILGFWLEPDVIVDQPFLKALSAAFRRFMAFTGAEALECSSTVPAMLCAYLDQAGFMSSTA